MEESTVGLNEEARGSLYYIVYYLRGPSLCIIYIIQYIRESMLPVFLVTREEGRYLPIK